MVITAWQGLRYNELFILFRFLCMSALSAYFTVCQKRATDHTLGGCESPCGCCDLNSGPLKEQPVLTGESFLQSHELP